MIWCIIGIGLFILSFVFNKLEKICRNKYRKTDNEKYYSVAELFDGLTCASFIVSIIIIAITSLLIVGTNSYFGTIGVQKAQEQHDMYIKLLEEDRDVIIQNQLYKDIVDYNIMVKKEKHLCNSLWTNWLVPEEWNKVECIDLK